MWKTETATDIFRPHHPAVTITSQGSYALCLDTIFFFFFFFLPVGEERGGISPDKGKEGDMKRAANKTGGGGGGGGGAAGGGGGGGVALWQPTLKASSSLFSDLPGPPEQAVCVCSCVCGGRVVRFSWKQSGSDHKNQLWDLFDSSDQTRFFFSATLVLLCKSRRHI